MYNLFFFRYIPRPDDLKWHVVTWPHDCPGREKHSVFRPTDQEVPTISHTAALTWLKKFEARKKGFDTPIPKKTREKKKNPLFHPPGVMKQPLRMECREENCTKIPKHIKWAQNPTTKEWHVMTTSVILEEKKKEPTTFQFGPKAMRAFKLIHKKLVDGNKI